MEPTKDDDSPMSDEELRDYMRKNFYALKPMILPGVILDPKFDAETYGDVIQQLKDELDKCLGNEIRDREMPLKSRELFFISGLADTASKIIQILECMSFRKDQRATAQLQKVAKAGVHALNRETERGNDWISKMIPYFSTWPTMYSPHNKIREQFTQPLDKLKMGSKALPSRPKLPWENSANQLVCSIYDYIIEVKRGTAYWEDDTLRKDMDIEIPDLVREIGQLEEPLSEENHLEWYKVGKMVLHEATDGRFQNHPEFQNDVLSQLGNAGRKFTDRIKDAWKNLSRAKFEPPRD